MSNNYDPFSRGPFPVGVRSQELVDSERERKLPVEFWYPATDVYKGQDLDDKTKDKYRLFARVKQDAVRDAQLREGSYPLVMFSHGFSGHHRQTTHFCCHLASHGYIIASPDHIGNTIWEVVENYMTTKVAASIAERVATTNSSIVDRPLDISFMINSLLAGKTSIPTNSIDVEKIGIAGHSFGGWTSLMVAGKDARIRAALPLAPAGGAPYFDDIMRLCYESLNLNWDREVPTLYLVAEGDTTLPLETMHDLFDRTRDPKRMIVLNNADHFHFCDMMEEVHEFFRTQSEMLGEDKTIAEKMRPFSELCPVEKAETYLRGLGLAHMDAYLKSNQSAMELLAGDIKALLKMRGIDVNTF